MFEYEIDGETIVIPREELKEKLSQNPNAKFVKEVEPGNTDPSPETEDAPVKENNTASDLETGSLEPPENDLEFTEVATEDKISLADFEAEQKGGAAIKEGEGVFVEAEDLTGYASNFYSNTTNLLNSNKTSEEKNQLFKKSMVPSNYIKGAVNIRSQENEDFNNNFKNLKTDIANFSNLNSEKQNNVIQQLFETAFTPQRNSPVASLYDQEINNIIKQTQKSVKKNNLGVINEVNDQWLKTEQGRREQQLESQYGRDLNDLEVNTLADRVAARDYYANQIEKNRFFEKALQNKNIEISKESKEIFSKLYDENQLVQTLTKKVSNAVYNYIDDEGTKIRRQEAGLSETPGTFARMEESLLKGIKQMESGFIGKEISKFDEIYDNYKNQSKSWENLNDNDIVLYKQYNFDALTGKSKIGGRKMTVKEAKKRQFNDMISKNKELFKLLETDTKLATALNTLGNNDRFVKEINNLDDFLNSPFLATLEMAPQIVAGAMTLGTSIIAQESGSNYNDQLTNIVADPENQKKIKAYLEKEGLEDTLNNKKLAAHFVLPEKLDKLTADIVGGVNGILEGIPFIRFVPGAKKILSKIIGPKLGGVFATAKQNIMSAKNFGLYSLSEGITEGLQGQASAIGQGVAEGGWKNKFKFLNFDNFIQEGLAGSKATLIPMSFGAAGTITSYVKATDGKTQKDKDAILEKERNRLKEDFEANFITLEEYNDGVAKLDSFQKIEEALAPSIKGEARIKMAGLINIKNKLKAEKQKRDEAFAPEYDEQIAGINSEIQNIVQSEKESRVDEVSIIKEPSVTISGKNRQIAQKNKELMAIIKDERTEESARRKAEGDLYINNQGLINDVVNKKFDPSKDTGLQRESLIAEANLAFVELMRTFTPARGEFGAYARRYIKLRLNRSIAELTGSQKNPETGKFEMAPKQDITETQVEDTITDDSSQVLEKVGTKLKSSFGLDDGTVNKIKNAVKKVFGTSLPAVTDKNFKKKTVQAFKDELTDLVKRDGIFGKDSQEFTAFLEDNAEAIYNSLPLEAMTKGFSRFTEKQINPKTGKPFREKTEVGKEIFIKKDFADVKDEFISYFTDRELGSSVRSDRKTSIAKQIADQLARDEVVDVLSDPEVSQKFKDVQELEGKEVPGDFLDRIVRELDRGLEWLNKQQQNNTLQFSLGVKEIAIAAGKLAINSIKVSLKAGDGIAKGLKVAVKAVQDAYGNREINPDIEKAIRNNVTRQKEGIKINDSGMQQALEIIMMEAQKDISTKLNIDDIQTILKNPKEIKKSVKFLEDSMQDIIKDLGPQAVDLLYKFGKNTFAHSPQGRLFVGKAGWDAWFKKSFPKFKPAKKEFNSDRPSSKKITPQLKKGTYNFEADKARANQAMQLYKSMFKVFVDKAKKNKGLNNQLGIMMTLLATPTQSVLRLAAPIKYSINIKTLNEPLHLEHLTPSAFINSLMFEYYYNGNTKFDIEKILKDYSVAIIPDGIKKILDEKGSSQKNQHPSYELGKKSPTVRIFNEDVKQLVQNTKYSNLILLDTQTGKPVNGFEINDKIIKEEQSKLGTEFNQILEESKGIEAGKEYTEAQGRNIGRKANRLKIFVPYSAEDLLGLLYRFAGQGKQGDAHLKWIKDNITTPLTESYIRFEVAQQAANGYLEAAKKLAKDSGIDFTKEAIDGYTVDQAIRIHIWSTSGYNLESLIGMSENQIERINKHVRQNYDVKAFEAAIKDAYINNDRKYPPPKDNTWISGTITTDLLNFTNTITREEAFKPFYDNIEAVFGTFDKNKGKLSGANLNKVKAIYGTNFVKALESSLYRIHTGRNRSYNLDQQGNSILNWVNNSIGTIMFFNTRSAVLQTLSNVNFTNWSDNNPFEIAKAWGNANQFKKDFVFLFNSDYLKSRRSGLKTDINEQEIATAVNSSNRVEALLAAILKKGFLPTQMADSFAIALGGATFYRNRTNKYKNDGMSQQEAEVQAFKDFREISEDSQQSSRPDKISMEQAGFAGRLILAFQNTPMQYNRLAKKALLDLINGRGDTKTNVTKIIWYLGVQNAIFYASQQALFSILFDSPETDDEEKREKERYFNLANGMADSVLRGSGVYGAILSTGKNTIIEILKKGTKEEDIIKALSAISPPINSKIRKVYSISKKFIYKQELKKMKELGLDSKNPAIMAGAEALSVGINLPADRAIKKINNLRYAFEEETEWWQSVALALGWSPYDVNIDTYEKSTKQPKPKLKGLSKKRNSKSRLKRKSLN